MNLWEHCNGKEQIKPIQAEPWRIVEAQHISSSRDLVDSREEHDLLEELLEESKPFINKNKHYLIFTPFRYPPLEYGSRFGQIYEPSLWYGSLELKTAFAEVAYYRLQFFKDSEGEFDYIQIPMTAFSAFLATNHGIDLTESTFDEHRNKISHPSSYTDSQRLGSAMREANIEAFIFYSARTKTLCRNIAAFTPNAFIQKKQQFIGHQENWICLANKNVIEFTRLEISKRERLVFSCEDYNKTAAALTLL